MRAGTREPDRSNIIGKLAIGRRVDARNTELTQTKWGAAE